MSETNPWKLYRGKHVLIQLRSQPYIGVTREELIPTAADGEFMSTPVVRGVIDDVFESGDDTYFVLSTTDPDESLKQNKVLIVLSVKRDVGYLTMVTSSKIIA
jgi:hypothetical protein